MPIVIDFRDITGSIASVNRFFSDFEPLLNRIVDEFFVPEIEHIFDTDGLGTWAPTSRPNPILRDTYRLQGSLTDRNHGEFLFEIQGNSLSADSDNSPVFYHKFHEDADQYNVPFPERPVIGLLDDTDPRIEDIVQDYIDTAVNDVLRQFGVSV